MKCTDCGGGTPAPLWKRCVKCAEKRLRVIMGRGLVPPPTKIARRYARGDRVFVKGEIQKTGTVVRVRDDQYTVQLDKGGRCYVTADVLQAE